MSVTFRRFHAVKGSPSNRPSPGSTNGDLLLTSPDRSVKQPTQQFVLIFLFNIGQDPAPLISGVSSIVPFTLQMSSDSEADPSYSRREEESRRQRRVDALTDTYMVLLWHQLFHRHPASPRRSHEHGGYIAPSGGVSEKFGPLLYHSPLSTYAAFTCFRHRLNSSCSFQETGVSTF